MEKTMINQKKIIEAVKNIPDIAEKESWVFTLDREEGTLFYSPKIIPSNTNLHQVTNEYALYINKNYEPKGVMVECYNGNFTKHHKTIEKISLNVFRGKEKVKVIDPNTNKKDDVTSLRALFEDTLIREIGTNLLPA